MFNKRNHYQAALEQARPNNVVRFIQTVGIPNPKYPKFCSIVNEGAEYRIMRYVDNERSWEFAHVSGANGPDKLLMPVVVFNDYVEVISEQ